MLKLARNVRATYAILTDELNHVTVSFDDCTKDTSIPYLSIESAEHLQLRLRIAAGIYDVAASRDFVRNASENPHYVEGALNDPRSGHEASDHLAEKKRLSDFDLYTMQRSPDLWFDCACWHEKVQQEALNNPISAGSDISIEPGGFARRVGLLRSPYPTQPLPQDTTDILRSSRKRPRNKALDRILRSSQCLSMTVVDAVRTGPRHFSQVVTAQLSICDETFCVKLFDERHFPVPWIRDSECIIGPPQYRLLSLNFSEDLARREEAFTLPDGWQCFGLIMENIEGPTLGTTFPTYNEDMKISMVWITTCARVCCAERPIRLRRCGIAYVYYVQTEYLRRIGIPAKSFAMNKTTAVLTSS
ncbi:hypothetical protein EIP86_005387 [Pleurotus ostreatoroseus]|nr:hypothetical protein EIP86_005387 [Pleurotus ostreatoroseus]